MHDRECSETGYENCVLTLGPKSIQKLKDWATKNGEDSPPPTISATLKDVREQIPHALEE